MQIHAIHISHVLSFDTFTWRGLDPHLNVIVGPNGVGKTNLFRALQTVRDAMRGELFPAMPTTRHLYKDNGETITIELEIQFTTRWEQQLLFTFLAAVLCNQREIQQAVSTSMQRSLDPNALKYFAFWVQEQMHLSDFTWLYHGRLVVTLVGRQGWQCQYVSLTNAPSFRLDLTHSGSLFGHAQHMETTEAQNWGSLFTAWRNHLSEEERTRLDTALTSETQERLFPDSRLTDMLDWLSSRQGVALLLEDQMQIVDPLVLAPRRLLSSLMQTDPESGRMVGIRNVFQSILERAFLFTDNVRRQPQRIFAADELLAQPIDLSSGEQLARFLFCKKNGGADDRHQYNEVKDVFTHMTGRTFDVVLNSAEAQQARTSMSLDLVTTSPRGDIPLEVSGAGIGEALFLSTILAGSVGRVVLLDEPALNLHPTMQGVLLDELQSYAQRPLNEGNQFLVNTHTASLVPSDAVDSVSRFTLRDGHTTRHALSVGETEQGVLDDLRKLLRGNVAARAFLFSSAVLLLEGETELGALPIWFPALARQNIALYAVGGKGAFASPLKLIQRFQIPWALVGDGEVLWDTHQRGHSHGPQDHVRALLSLGNQSLPSLTGDPGRSDEDFTQWKHALEPFGIFTLAGGANEGFERALRTDIPSDLWARADVQFGSNKVACGHFIARNAPCPKKVAEMAQKIMGHLRGQGADVHYPLEYDLT